MYVPIIEIVSIGENGAFTHARYIMWCTFSRVVNFDSVSFSPLTVFLLVSVSVFSSFFVGDAESTVVLSRSGVMLSHELSESSLCFPCFHVFPC
mgnify:CR=1 FL=1